MEVKIMLRIRPLKVKKMNRHLTMALAKDLATAPKAPTKQLKKEANDFEKLIKSRRAAGMR